MKRWLFFLLVGAAAAADAPVQKAPVPGSRFLFILNTSSGMRRCRTTAEACVAELISNGSQGRMKAGDTFGIWTFDKTLHAGEFPMKLWTPELSTALAGQVRGFLAKKTYGSKPRFESMAGPLSSVARSSRSLLVFLLTDGGEPVKGTPFDRALNQAITRNYKAMKERRLPFLIVLGVEEGQYTDIKLNSTLNIVLPEVARVAAESAVPAGATNAPASLPEAAQSRASREPLAAPRPVANEDPGTARPGQTNELSAIPAEPPPRTPPSEPPSETKPATVKPLEEPVPAQAQVSGQPAPPATLAEARTNLPAQNLVAKPATNAPNLPSPGPSADPVEAPAKPAIPAALAQSSPPSAAQNPAGNTAMLLWAAFGFLFASASLLWMLLRGSKRPSAPSLISRSVEKSKHDG